MYVTRSTARTWTRLRNRWLPLAVLLLGLGAAWTAIVLTVRFASPLTFP
jgi:hypothetical protein